MRFPFKTIAVAVLGFLPFGASASTIEIKMTPAPIARYSGIDRSSTMDVETFLTTAFSVIGDFESVPKTSRYIELRYSNVSTGSEAYAALQKGVYLDLIDNVAKPLPLKATVTEGVFARLLQRATGDTIDTDPNKPLTEGVLLDTLADLYDKGTPKEDASDVENFPILNDVYDKLRSEYVDPSKVEKVDLIRGAIEGLATATGDKHTVYFPPTESKDFQDEMAGEFEGIGAYVDMTTPGVMKITAPISGSPAERAGLKAGDTILSVDDLVIDKTVSLEAAVSRIKGPAGTQVKLRIRRGETDLDFSVTREKVTVQYVEYKKLDDGTPYIRISMFGAGTLAGFANAVGSLKTSGADQSRLVIDLRNDPGGSLDEVDGILSYFVPKGQPVVKIHYRNAKTEVVSGGSDNSLSNRKVAILVNGGSASASEIMAGTIRDYLTGAILVGEKTYGKGSVQSFVPYADGSSIKYTVAKWFTGKTETGIDGTGLIPDVEVAEASGSTNTGATAIIDAPLQKALELLKK